MSAADVIQVDPSLGMCMCANGMCQVVRDGLCQIVPESNLTATERHSMSLLMEGQADLSPAAINKSRQNNLTHLIAAFKGEAAGRDVASASFCDVGSGTGDLAKFMVEAVGGNSANLKCYDVVPPEQNAQSIAAINVTAGTDEKRVQVQMFDGTSLPEADASADVVSCIFVLHHAGEAQVPLLHDMIRVSREWLFICEDLNEPEFVQRNQMHDINGVFRTNEGWKTLWAELGLEVVASGRCVPELKGPQQYYLLRKEPKTPVPRTPSH